MADAALRLVHRVPGRARFEAPCLRDDAAAAAGLVATLSGVEGVGRVQARPATGSVVIAFDGEWEVLRERLTANGLQVTDPPAGSADVHAMDAASVFVEGLDDRVRRVFGGRADLSELAFFGLLAAGVVQLGRGRVVGPAATLFAQALSLMASRRRP